MANEPVEWDSTGCHRFQGKLGDSLNGDVKAIWRQGYCAGRANKEMIQTALEIACGELSAYGRFPWFRTHHPEETLRRVMQAAEEMREKVKP